MNQLKTKKLLQQIRYKPNPQLILLRGLPGSGKSTLARKIVQSKPKFCHFEADQYFYSADKHYQFNPQHLPQAHQHCFDQTKAALLSGKSVVVANTFVRKWELQGYLQLAQRLKFNCTVFTCEGKWQSVHNVPGEVLKRMQQQWQIF
ncbi:ATP-binding protein [Catenovulum sp. SX2]|uniref:ATP-binding protein n=1 Tax=Catenovulum sp. SX2 TaxID=3398614 RepID=UPI003F848AC9